MSSLLLLCLPLNLPLLVSIRSIIYFPFFELRSVCSGSQFMLDDKKEEKIERRGGGGKRKDFSNITQFPSFHN